MGSNFFQVDKVLTGRVDPVVEAFNIVVGKGDIATLGDGQWLNDEVINFYGNMIMERNNKDLNKYPKVHVFSTHFYSTLRDNGDNGFNKVKRWTKKASLFLSSPGLSMPHFPMAPQLRLQIDLFTYKYVIVPVHLGMHWCCAVINFDQKRIEYYDSLRSKNDQCMKLLREYISKEHLDKKNGQSFDLTGWTNFTPTVSQIHIFHLRALVLFLTPPFLQDIPTQKNGFDCGVFACMFGEFTSRGLTFLFPWFFCTSENFSSLPLFHS